MTYIGGKIDPEIMELNLILIYLNGWQEDSRKEVFSKVFRSWKGYPFDILNELEKQNMIRQFDKSLVVTKVGISKAEWLLEKYFDPQKIKLKMP
jgi:hypothetical protein